MKRIFIAIPASEELIAKIRELRAENPTLPVVWAKDHNLHITLVPPRELNDEQEEQLRHSLAHCLAEGVFTIHFDKISFGPSEGELRLLWATGESTPEIIQLKTAIEECIGYVPDHEFLLHLTLGRLEHILPDQFAAEKFEHKTHLKMKVDRYAVMSSLLLPDGPEYKILEEYPI